MEREITYEKLHRMRELLAKRKESRTGADLGHTIGIFSALKDNQVKWLQEKVLNTEFFSGLVKKIKLIYIPDITLKKIEKSIAEYSFFIYVSSDQMKPPLFKKELLAILESSNPMLVVKVEEDSSDERKNKILTNEPSIGRFSHSLFLFSKLERKCDFQKLLSAGRGDPSRGQGVRTTPHLEENTPPSHQAQDIDHHNRRGDPSRAEVSTTPYLEQHNPLYQEVQDSEHQYRRGDNVLQLPKNINLNSFAERFPKGPVGNRYSVGIFSRSAEEDYSWLVALLKSEDFRDQILDIRSCAIYNNGFHKFTEDVCNCRMGILYHTKNRGRLNITDVSDSLYDDELEYLSTTLGKDNVIVLVDDLNDSSDKEKALILQAQPKIVSYAKDLILISAKDKSEEKGQVAKLKIQKMFPKLEAREADSPFPAPSGITQYLAADHRQSLERVLSQQQKHLPVMTVSDIRETTSKKRSTIGLISRSEESDYSWLRNLLLTEDVRNYKISSDQCEALKEAAYNCKYIILYHSVKTGSMRTTDEKVSLYDDELERLSGKLGSRRVILVVDDMMDNSDNIKAKILKNFPNIKNWTADIFLFTEKEKKSLAIKSQENDKRQVNNKTNVKIQRMREILDVIKRDTAV